MRVLVRQLHRLRLALVELSFESGREEGGYRKDVFVSGESTLITTHSQGDYGASQVAIVYQRSASRFGHSPKAMQEEDSRPNRRTIQFLLQLRLRVFAIDLLDRFRRLARAIFRMKRALEHVD